jgi:hypothetical protein
VTANFIYSVVLADFIISSTEHRNGPEGQARRRPLHMQLQNTRGCPCTQNLHVASQCPDVHYIWSGDFSSARKLFGFPRCEPQCTELSVVLFEIASSTTLAAGPCRRFPHSSTAVHGTFCCTVRNCIFHLPSAPCCEPALTALSRRNGLNCELLSFLTFSCAPYLMTAACCPRLVNNHGIDWSDLYRCDKSAGIALAMNISYNT